MPSCILSHVAGKNLLDPSACRTKKKKLPDASEWTRRSKVKPLVSLMASKYCGLLASFLWHWPVLQSISHVQECSACGVAHQPVNVCARVRVCARVGHVIAPKCSGITLWCACQIRLSSHTTYQCGGFAAPALAGKRSDVHSTQYLLRSFCYFWCLIGGKKRRFFNVA